MKLNPCFYSTFQPFAGGTAEIQCSSCFYVYCDSLASVMQQINNDQDKSEVCIWLKEAKICHLSLLSKSLLPGLSVMTGYQNFLKSESRFWCFGTFQLLSVVSLLTWANQAFPEGLICTLWQWCRELPNRFSGIAQLPGSWGPIWVSSLLSPFKACRLWPVNWCLNRV